MDQIPSFLGKGWAFPIRFSPQQGSVVMSVEEKDIYQSLWLLMSTQPGERQTRPRYGCPLQDFVHAPVNNSTFNLIRESIRQSVLEFEPRIDLNEVNFEPSKDGSGALQIEIVYTVRTTNSRTNIVFPFYQLEGTNVQEV